MSVVTGHAYVSPRSRASAGKMRRTSPSVSASTGFPTRTPPPCVLPNSTVWRTLRAAEAMWMVEFSFKIEGSSSERNWLYPSSWKRTWP